MKTRIRIEVKRFWKEHLGTAIILVMLTVVIGTTIVVKYLSNDLSTRDTWVAIGALAFLIGFVIVVKQQNLENL